MFSYFIDKYECRKDATGTANDANNDSSSSGANEENKTITVKITISSDGNDTAEKVTATDQNTTTTSTTTTANDETTAAVAAAPATVDVTKWTEIQRKVSKFIENNYFQLFVTAIILVASVTLVTKASIDTILINFVGGVVVHCDVTECAAYHVFNSFPSPFLSLALSTCLVFFLLFSSNF